MELQADITQRQPLLSQSEEELEFQEDTEEPLDYHKEKYTVLEKLLAFACGWLLLGMCLFAFLYHRQGGGHQHESAMDMSQFDQVNIFMSEKKKTFGTSGGRGNFVFGLCNTCVLIRN